MEIHSLTHIAGMGTSHLEYGFPSTHSTTAVAQALVLKQWLDESDMSDTVKVGLHLLLIIATSSVVFGRFYCDLGAMPHKLNTRTGLYAIHAHVEPAEDNPAFEDSVAFISVFLGNGIGEWFANTNGYGHSTYFVTKLQGWEWYLASLLKYPLGVGMIFLTRLLTKPFMQVSLPPMFRLLHRVVTLPNRREYVPATEYTDYRNSNDKLDPVPSVVDLRQLQQRKEDAAQTPQPLPERFSGRHYDAEVMTRVVAYAAMGFVGTIVSPIVFEKLGWGLY
ncbi:hypothetical protein E3P77_00899 [Wallemia ichthyophaga]|uniref:Phosphatidic acid phosphatase type 2/haloperoxidase domain-containing protein n=1 Tax=Wallemia ichthyophaga TaxID=245174 RepID=A0A4T0FYC3_WALIC|nr:hypothetical protein E3P97_01253 [Wallemia ichthyophaga]TIA98186.1 hypothetical protein E3P95_02559 [Wallemia ichthyophaga]TIB15077.1 hypothetical protein E3P90_00998 [Wallemia ichthyophaga]TIB16886.1 hypothetical protein E3P93_00855 [Wallemia ichthyophaga]TIB26689.1 hypothetical protein E3P88_00867 [Wallemia ichthyophaga]